MKITYSISCEKLTQYHCEVEIGEPDAIYWAESLKRALDDAIELAKLRHDKYLWERSGT